MTRNEALRAAEEALDKSRAIAAFNTTSVERADVYANRAKTYVRIAQGYIELARALDTRSVARDC